jgi:hypothetical protein
MTTDDPRRGMRVRIDWHTVPDYPAGTLSDYGRLSGVDGIGTATIVRDDGCVIVAGAGCWQLAESDAR